MKFVTLTAAGALFAGAAYAGGIAPAPIEPVPMAPAPIIMPSEDWTGGYAGLSAGYAGMNLDGSDDILDGILGDDDDDEDDFFEVDGDGLIGGAFAGYQYDFGNFVLGAEVDLNATNLDFGDDEFFGGDVNFDDDDETDGGISVRQIHRAKLRAGFDAGDALIYGVAGAAYLEAEGVHENLSDMGYVLGAGIDYKVTEDVVVGAEVLHHQFDDFDDTGINADVTSIQARVAYQF